MAALKLFRNAEVRIPACAGMTIGKFFFLNFLKIGLVVVFVGKAHATVGLLIGFRIKGRLKPFDIAADQI